jgi:hypothetical protein
MRKLYPLSGDSPGRELESILNASFSDVRIAEMRVQGSIWRDDKSNKGRNCILPGN